MRYTKDVEFVRKLGNLSPPPGDPDDVKYVTRFCNYDLPVAERGKVGLWQRIWQAAQRLADDADERAHALGSGGDPADMAETERAMACARAIRGHVVKEMTNNASKSAEWWLKSFGARRRPEHPGWDLPSVKAIYNKLAAAWYDPEHAVQKRARELEAANAA